jgi:hypothetical protein
MAGILYRSLAIAYTGQVGCRADLILEAANILQTSPPKFDKCDNLREFSRCSPFGLMCLINSLSDTSAI